MLVCVAALGVALAGGSARAGDESSSAKCLKYKKVKGKRVCAKRAPAFVTGHYAGVTSQNAALSFDLGVSGATVTLSKITFVELDNTCDPDVGSLAFASATATKARLDAKGRFHVQLVTQRATGRGVLTVDGVVTAKGAAAGTATDAESENVYGLTAVCSSGGLTWRAGAGAAAVQPAAKAPTGHYHGTTSQAGGAGISFDVASVGGILYAQNILIKEIDESCEPNRRNIALSDVTVPNTPVDGRGKLRFYLKRPDPVSPLAMKVFGFEGTIDTSGHGSGTLVDQHHEIHDDSGYLPVDYACTTPPVTWTVNGP